MKSIMHDRKDGTCYLCMKLHGDYSRKSVLQEHHAIGGNGKRGLSEQHGLKVYLCPQHHINGLSPEAVHGNIKIRRYVEAAAQEAFEAYFPEKDFIEVFGGNTKGRTERRDSRQQSCEEGFRQQADGFICTGGTFPLPDCLRD